MKEKILVSSCFLGNKCRWNGESNYNENVVALEDNYEFIKACPELMGGLGVPRKPCEIIKDKPYTIDLEEISAEFNEGMAKMMFLVNKYGIKKALMKDGSPSCGVYKIKDGTFSGKAISGSGIATRVLKENNIEVFSEDDLEKLK